MKRQTWFTIAALGIVISAQPLRLTAQPAETEKAPTGNSATAPSSSGAFIVFEVPNSSCSDANAYLCIVTSIDPQGTVTGQYVDAAGLTRGFYRLVNGAITSFDPPGVRCTEPVPYCTSPTSINAGGTIAGSFFDGILYAGFLRDRFAHFSQFSVPNATQTLPQAINSAGVVTGIYLDPSNVFHGFVRDTSGNMTEFDAPDAAHHIVSNASINSAGQIVGSASDGYFTQYGFLRQSDGTLTILAPPQGFIDVIPTGIDDGGRIVGNLDGNSFRQPFIRSPKGNFFTFSVPGATQTTLVAIDQSGTIIGYYSDSQLIHGFFRLQNGVIRTFDPPNSLYTTPTTINLRGDIAGYFTDTNGTSHLFIRKGH